MLLSLRHFLKPEDILFLKFMLFRGDVISCDYFFIQGRIKVVSHLSLSCVGWHHRLGFLIECSEAIIL